MQACIPQAATRRNSVIPAANSSTTQAVNSRPASATETITLWLSCAFFHADHCSIPLVASNVSKRRFSQQIYQPISSERMNAGSQGTTRIRGGAKGLPPAPLRDAGLASGVTGSAAAAASKPRRRQPMMVPAITYVQTSDLTAERTGATALFSPQVWNKQTSKLSNSYNSSNDTRTLPTIASWLNGFSSHGGNCVTSLTPVHSIYAARALVH